MTISDTGLTPTLVEFRDGLRELADWIEQHPYQAAEFSLSKVTILAPTGGSVARLRALGVALGVDDLDTRGEWAQYVRSFGGVLEVQAYAKKGDVCDYKVVGVKTEEVREWTLRDAS